MTRDNLIAEQARIGIFFDRASAWILPENILELNNDDSENKSWNQLTG